VGKDRPKRFEKTRGSRTQCLLGTNYDRLILPPRGPHPACVTGSGLAVWDVFADVMAITKCRAVDNTHLSYGPPYGPDLATPPPRKRTSGPH